MVLAPCIKHADTGVEVGADLSAFVESSYAQIPILQSLRARSIGILLMVRGNLLKLKILKIL